MNTKIVDKSENGKANPIVQGGLNLTGSIHHPKMNILLINDHTMTTLKVKYVTSVISRRFESVWYE